jgi:MoaA/NifB/PqqE/SkfB family radical SAM enzyme
MWKTAEEGNEVSTSEWKYFITSLADLLGLPQELVFTGGEPLLKNDTLELVKFATQKGFKTIMTSNGYLIDDNVAKQIAKSGLKEISVSLDSINYKTHDFLRGVEGAYYRVMKAFDSLYRYCPGLRLGIITVISGVNYKEIVDLVQWVKKAQFLSGVYFQVIAKPFFVPLDDNWYKDSPYEFLWPKDIVVVHSMLDNLINLRNNGYPIHNFPLQLEIFKTYFKNPLQRVREAKCHLGDYVINIDPPGNISLCCFMKPFGNIKKDDIRKLWYSEIASQLRTKMHSCDINCNNRLNCFFKDENEI